MSSYSAKLWLCIALCFAACHLPTFAVVVNSSEYSLITKEQMLALPRAERTVAAALRLCLERSSANQFCAWLLVEPQTELVLGGTCFDESLYSCSRYGYTGTKSNRRRYRYLTCNGCSSCYAQRSACQSANCTMKCFCSCGHGYNSDRGFVFDPSGSDWHFVYPCSGVCDGKTHCPYGEDEHRHLCTTLETASKDWAFRGFAEFSRSSDFYVFCIGAVFGLCFLGFSLLNMKYKWYPWMLTPIKNRRAAAAALLLEQERQQQQQQQQQYPLQQYPPQQYPPQQYPPQQYPPQQYPPQQPVSS